MVIDHGPFMAIAIHTVDRQSTCMPSWASIANGEKIDKEAKQGSSFC